MGYAIIDSASKLYFVRPSFWSWDLKSDRELATLFKTKEEADEMKEILDRAIGGTFWDYDDIIPMPKVVYLEEER